MHAIRATRAFDGERFRQGGATVLVEEDRIAGVEPFGFEVPDEVPVASYDGTLLPGLFDCHVHLVGNATPGGLEAVGGWDEDKIDATIRESLVLQAAAGVTTVRDLGDRRYRTLVARDRNDPGLPRIVASGPPLTIPGGHCHYWGGEVDGADSIRALVAAHADRGVDVVKVMATGGMMTPGTDIMGAQFGVDELRVAAEAAHDRGLRLVAHAHSVLGAWNALRAGADGLEHFTSLTDDGSVMPDNLLTSIAEAGLTVDLTVGWNYDRIASVDQLPPPIRQLVQRLGLTPDSLRRTRREQLAQMQAHGIRIVSGLDAGVSPPKSHSDSWRAVAEAMVALGPEVGLATATSVAAEDCGLGTVTGRLAPGYAADLLVVDGDVAADPESMSRPVVVLLRGVPPASG